MMTTDSSGVMRSTALFTSWLPVDSMWTGVLVVSIFLIEY